MCNYKSISSQKPLKKEDLEQIGLGGGISTKDRNNIGDLVDEFRLFKVETISHLQDTTNLVDSIKEQLDKLGIEFNNHSTGYVKDKAGVEGRLDELEKFTIQCVKNDEFKRAKDIIKQSRENIEKTEEKVIFKYKFSF